MMRRNYTTPDREVWVVWGDRLPTPTGFRWPNPWVHDQYVEYGHGRYMSPETYVSRSRSAEEFTPQQEEL